MQRQVDVHHAQHLLKAVAQFAVPRQKRRSALDMRRLMDFILLEPIGHGSRWKVDSAAGEGTMVQRDDRVAEPLLLLQFHCGCKDVPQTSIPYSTFLVLHSDICLHRMNTHS